MYSPYSTSTQRNKSRLYLLIFLLFIGIILYWRYSSSNKQTFQSAGEHIHSAIEHGKDRVGHVIHHGKDKVDVALDAVKDKANKAADNLQQAANDIKNKL